MIEVASSELPEDEMRAAFEFAHSQVRCSGGRIVAPQSLSAHPSQPFGCVLAAGWHRLSTGRVWPPSRSPQAVVRYPGECCASMCHPYHARPMGSHMSSARCPLQYPTAEVAAATSEAFYQKAKTFWRTSFASKGERSAAQGQLTADVIREVGSQFPDVTAETLALVRAPHGGTSTPRVAPHPSLVCVWCCFAGNGCAA